jgi:hypothetical protein
MKSNALACVVKSDKDFFYMNESFDLFGNANNKEFRADLLKNKNIKFLYQGGKNYSAGIKVEYIGNNMGSERVTGTCVLTNSYDYATLKFDVYFDEEFQWAHGGKLHGIGSFNPVTGGRTKVPQDWSVRILFKENGVSGLYIYDESIAKWGNFVSTNIPVFKKGIWQNVMLTISLNDVPASNGFAELFIDGVSVVKVDNLTLRGGIGKKSRISTILFNTFYGGNTKKWAPTIDGRFINTAATFDNFMFISTNTLKHQNQLY